MVVVGCICQDYIEKIVLIKLCEDDELNPGEAICLFMNTPLSKLMSGSLSLSFYAKS